MKHLSKDELWSQVKKSSASNSNTYEMESQGQENEAEPVESNNAAEESLIGGEQEASIDDAQQNVEPSESNQVTPLAHDGADGDQIPNKAPEADANNSQEPLESEKVTTSEVVPDATGSPSDEKALVHTDQSLCPETGQGNQKDVQKKTSCQGKLQKIENIKYPDQPNHGSNQPPLTLANLAFLLSYYGVTVRYNVFKKKLMITMPNHIGTTENMDDVMMTHIINLVILNNLPTGQVPAFIAALADRNIFNPVADWITSKPWDGKDRLPDMCDTLVEHNDYQPALKNTLVIKWLLSATAAALLPHGFQTRGVPVLQGPQGIGKTSWVRSLIPDRQLRDMVLKVDHHMDGSNKDSVIGGITNWIVEIGELDSSFKKDIARLKGFLTRDSDKLRLPYGRTVSEYQRRTVFIATVNQPDFLVDNTGNSRWWTIPVTKINYNHGIDMQQVFAQLADDLKRGLQWWLTPEEEAMLNKHNLEHRSISVIRERFLEEIDLNLIGKDGNPAMTASQVLGELGYKSPTNTQCKECAAILRELLGDPKKIRGNQTYRIPLKRGSGSFTSIDDE